MKDETLEQTISNLLRLGISVAASLGLIGGLWLLSTTGSQPVAFGTFQGAAPVFRSPITTVQAILHPNGPLRPLALIQLGILVLLATPILRVAFSALGFIREKDHIYVLITLIVLGTLLTSALLL